MQQHSSHTNLNIRMQLNQCYDQAACETYRYAFDKHNILNVQLTIKEQV